MLMPPSSSIDQRWRQKRDDDDDRAGDTYVAKTYLKRRKKGRPFKKFVSLNGVCLNGICLFFYSFELNQQMAAVSVSEAGLA